MAGRRLLDAALVLSAARTIARQHFRIRGEQIDTWSKTSTVAKAIKSQTDRVTLTAAAARALATRLNEEAPQQFNYAKNTAEDAGVLRRDAADQTGDEARREGIQQDHHYKRSESNATHQPVPTQESEVTQKAAGGMTQPDGTILPKGSATDSQTGREEQLESDAERGQAPAKEPLAQEQSRKSNEAVEPEASNQSTLDGIRSSSVKMSQTIPEHDATPAQESLPDGINTDVFHSPKIADMLSGRAKKNPYEELRLRRSAEAPVEKSTKKHEMDQETFSTRQPQPSTSETATATAASSEATSARAEADVSDLAADIAKEAEAFQTVS